MLPPLPGSDVESIRKDSYDRFYKKRPSEVWMGFTEQKKISQTPKCEHFFEETKEGVQCKMCHFGLIGKELKVRKGKVYFGKQKLL